MYIVRTLIGYPAARSRPEPVIVVRENSTRINRGKVNIDDLTD